MVSELVDTLSVSAPGVLGLTKPSSSTLRPSSAETVPVIVQVAVVPDEKLQ